MQNQTSGSPERQNNFHLQTVLLVEECEIWGNVLSRYLTARGLDVTWLHSPEGVLPFILDVDPDMIVVGDATRNGDSDLIDEIGKLGPETKARMLILTGEKSTLRHPNGFPVVRKSNLFGIGNWVDQRTGMFPPLPLERNQV